MKFEVKSADVGGGAQQLAGGALGDRLFRDRIEPALFGLGSHGILLLSFRGVASVTGSIIKATWHRLHPSEGVMVPTMLTHLSEDVRGEFAIYLRSEGLAGLEASDWTKTSVTLATLHGKLEGSAISALQALTANPGATAPQLQSMSQESVSATAWTNRLNELHRQGLAVREKGGRAWRFYPLAEELRVDPEVSRG
jgi:hypothetical protein